MSESFILFLSWANHDSTIIFTRLCYDGRTTIPKKNPEHVSKDSKHSDKISQETRGGWVADPGM